MERGRDTKLAGRFNRKQAPALEAYFGGPDLLAGPSAAMQGTAAAERTNSVAAAIELSSQVASYIMKYIALTTGSTGVGSMVAAATIVMDEIKDQLLGWVIDAIDESDSIYEDVDWRSVDATGAGRPDSADPEAFYFSIRGALQIAAGEMTGVKPSSEQSGVLMGTELLVRDSSGWRVMDMKDARALRSPIAGAAMLVSELSSLRREIVLSTAMANDLWEGA